MWLVGGDRASGFVLEDGVFGVAGGVDVLVVEVFVVAGAEQDHLVDLGLPQREGDPVMGLEFVHSGATRVIAQASSRRASRRRSNA